MTFVPRKKNMEGNTYCWFLLTSFDFPYPRVMSIKILCYVPSFYVVFSFIKTKLRRIARNCMGDVRGEERKGKEEKTFCRVFLRPSRWCYKNIAFWTRAKVSALGQEENFTVYLHQFCFLVVVCCWWCCCLLLLLFLVNTSFLKNCPPNRAFTKTWIVPFPRLFLGRSRFECESCLLHLIAKWLKTSYIFSLNLSFIIYKMEVRILHQRRS